MKNVLNAAVDYTTTKFGSNPKNLSLTIPNQTVYSYPPYSIHVFRGVGTTDGIWMVLLLGPVTSGSRIGIRNDVIIQDSCHSFVHPTHRPPTTPSTTA
jgi:hypothetical protein